VQSSGVLTENERDAQQTDHAEDQRQQLQHGEQNEQLAILVAIRQTQSLWEGERENI
jgi:hypothetical protein